MSRTIADASRDYRNRRKERLERYEAALAQIAHKDNGLWGAIAKKALQD